MTLLFIFVSFLRHFKSPIHSQNKVMWNFHLTYFPPTISSYPAPFCLSPRKCVGLFSLSILSFFFPQARGFFSSFLPQFHFFPRASGSFLLFPPTFFSFSGQGIFSPRARGFFFFSLPRFHFFFRPGDFFLFPSSLSFFSPGQGIFFTFPSHTFIIFPRLGNLFKLFPPTLSFFLGQGIFFFSLPHFH